MIDKAKIDTLLQIISSMEEGVKKLEESYKKKNVRNFEHSKEILLEFQKKLSEELKKEEGKK